MKHKASKPYALKTRWEITGRFTTRSPLHIGSGGTTERDGLCDAKDKKVEIAAVACDYLGHPIIPGTALKGVLRAWGERFFGEKYDCLLSLLFGHAGEGRNAGNAEFAHGVMQQPDTSALAKHIPYWCPQSTTGVLSHVALNRQFGTADDQKLFYEEFVPAGVSFDITILADRLSDAEIGLLLDILELGANHPTHPYQFGANSADGWGRMTWRLAEVKRFDPSNIFFDANSNSFRLNSTNFNRPALQEPTAAPKHQPLKLTLECAGAFLVNDASHAKHDEMTEDEKLKHTDFVYLRNHEGKVWLPASSLRGALRERAEFIACSLDPTGMTDSINRLFGSTVSASRLLIEEIYEVTSSSERHQDFVAIDRFTGGAADGAKFDAKYADKPTFAVRMLLNTEPKDPKNDLQPQDMALLAAALRDLCVGRVALGFGRSKGYGDVTGKLDEASEAWAKSQLPNLPAPSATSQPIAITEAKPVDAKTIQGTLRVTTNSQGKPERKIEFVRKNGKKDKTNTLNPTQFDTSIRDALIDGMEVDFEWENDVKELNPKNIRKRGEQLSKPHPQRLVPQEMPADQGKIRKFAHAYYFLHVDDREKLTNESGDSTPTGHLRYHEGRVSGTIHVKLKTKTPLLLCDDDNREEDKEVKGHFSYGMRVDTSGRPILHASSVRGMLRAAYEAVTNSRFGVFPFDPNSTQYVRQAHARHYGYRMQAGEGLSLVPARIENGKAKLMLGTNPELPYMANNRWRLPNDLVHAAWVPRYTRNATVIPNHAIRVAGNLPSHGQSVWCWIELVEHLNPYFKFWRVREAAAAETELSAEPPARTPKAGNYSPTAEEFRKVQGLFCITNQSIDRKHDERFFFFTTDTDKPVVDIPDPVRQQYTSLVRDYQILHEEELRKREQEGIAPDAYTGREPGKTAWSRHVYDISAANLSDGTLCYAKAAKLGATYSIEALYPVIISRKLYPDSPLALLPTRLRPASKMSELSPADRVFGWVAQHKNDQANDQAYRSQVRFGAVKCDDTNAVVTLPEDLRVLPILAQPKPAQGRFYLKRKDGNLVTGTKEEAGYNSAANRIRGPKVYPHHKNFNLETVLANAAVKSKQNRSITGYVKKDTEFTFTLHVLNLSRIELGALLWLLDLPPDCFHRLGLGKPLGFGSVRVSIDEKQTCLADGKDWTGKMCEWDASPSKPLTKTIRDGLKSEFEVMSMKESPGLLQAFLNNAAGFDRVCYPPAQDGNNSDSQHFQWFANNEARLIRHPREEPLSLPELSNPLLPERP